MNRVKYLGESQRSTIAAGKQWCQNLDNPAGERHVEGTVKLREQPVNPRSCVVNQDVFWRQTMPPSSASEVRVDPATIPSSPGRVWEAMTLLKGLSKYLEYPLSSSHSWSKPLSAFIYLVKTCILKGKKELSVTPEKVLAEVRL